MTAVLEVEEIFQWLKESRQGEGLTVAKVHHNERLVEVFGDGSASKAFEHIRSVADQLNATPAVVAACNALAIGVPVQRNTTARRVTLLAEQEDMFAMTKRNLLRTEDRGLKELAVALYSQQPGAGKVPEEFTESPSEDVNSSAEQTTENALEELWEALLMLAQRIVILEKRPDIDFILDMAINGGAKNDEQFRRAYDEWKEVLRESPNDFDAIIKKTESVHDEARRVRRELYPVPLIGDSLQIDAPNILKPSI